MSTIQNSVMLIGHLGDNPEEVKLDSNKKLTTFSVATNLRYKNKDGNYSNTIIAFLEEKASGIVANKVKK